MPRRQTNPQAWLIVNDETDLKLAERLRRGSGVLVLAPIRNGRMRKLRRIARSRDLVLARESARTAARVHNSRELRRAMLARTPIILLSPLFATRTHPEWQPIPRMRAAALARLGRRKLLALGGVDARRFARIQRLGFKGWAGISAFRT